MKWPKIRALNARYLLVVLFVLLALAYLRFAPDSLKPWVTAPQPVVVQPKDPAAKVERIYIPGPERIRVIEKVKYLEKVPDALTPSTVQDNTAHVVASAVIPPSVAGGVASAILHVKDGVGTGNIEYKPATPPFIAVQKEFGARAGVGTGGLVIGEIYARPLRVGPVTVEVRGFAQRSNISGADFGGAVLLDYRF